MNVERRNAVHPLDILQEWITSATAEKISNLCRRGDPDATTSAGDRVADQRAHQFWDAMMVHLMILSPSDALGKAICDFEMKRDE